METNTNQEFKIIVWYRCIRAGEMEKDYQDYKINAKNVQEAVNIVSEKFKSHAAIPFSYEHNGQKYSPNNFDKKFLQ
jgi:hypothetical protein